jgi:hypothetical protein
LRLNAIQLCPEFNWCERFIDLGYILERRKIRYMEERYSLETYRNKKQIKEFEIIFKGNRKQCFEKFLNISNILLIVNKIIEQSSITPT